MFLLVYVAHKSHTAITKRPTTRRPSLTQPTTNIYCVATNPHLLDLVWPLLHHVLHRALARLTEVKEEAQAVLCVWSGDGEKGVCGCVWV